jgi:hypothetical protein
VAEPDPQVEEIPVSDAATRELRYRYHRARRHARIRQKEETRLARYRFFILMTVLVVGAIVFVVLAWQAIHKLFGL